MKLSMLTLDKPRITKMWGKRTKLHRAKAFVHAFQAIFTVIMLRLFLMNVSLLHNLRYQEKLSQNLSLRHGDTNRIATQITGMSSDPGMSSNNPYITGTTVALAGCQCDLMSIDCLETIKCLPSLSESQHLIAMGVTTRRLLKQMTTFEGKVSSFHKYPIGKGLQYSFIKGYKRWKRELQLPKGMEQTQPTIFVNETWYPYCKENDIKGKACFLGDLESDEEMDEMEKTALAVTNIPDATKAQISSNLRDFYNRSNTPGSKPTIPALGYLLFFSHIARIHFHRNPPVLQFYHNRTTSVMNVPKTSDALHVSVHLRRADSCSHRRGGYETKASELDSKPQVSGERMCYNTSVYMNALQRVQRESGRSLEVYLSTDDAGSVMDEIQNDFNDLFMSLNWHYLDYSRETFQYQGTVEGNQIESAQQAMLGESAIADLWHMSHGEVFIGHLGSRFGKISWLLATGRHNRFVPFFTVDGHSVCCEIDENCASMKPYITNMEECLTFNSELAPIPMNEDYWDVGSLKRKIMAEMEKNKTTSME